MDNKDLETMAIKMDSFRMGYITCLQEISAMLEAKNKPVKNDESITKNK